MSELKITIRHFALLSLFLLQLLLASATVLAQPAVSRVVTSDARSAGFRFTTDTTQPLIHYQQHVHLIAGTGDRASVKVYGNGRVEVHYPVYMKRAGDYVMQLSESELAALLRSMSSKGIMDFDENIVKQRMASKERAMRQQGDLYAVSDALESVVDIKLDEYQKNNRTKKIERFDKRFKWKNIEQDAKRFKDEVDIVNANSAVQQLRALMQDPRLVRQP